MMAPSSRQSLERDDNGEPRFRGCSSIRDYKSLGKLGEGTFGEVYKAECRKTKHLFAMKKILMYGDKDGFPITALREIKLLKMLSHPNILQLKEMAIEKPERQKKPVMYMVMPYMEHDLSGLLENPDVTFTEPQIKCYLLQLLKGVQYLHESGVLHRDMKAANLLISNKGILQIADFGLARPYDEPPPQPGKGAGEARRDYTPLVVTRWYRPPELLLQLRRYTTAIDMWGVGCVFGEMFKGKPILPGTSDLNQANLIFGLVGSPTEENMPGWSALPGCEGVKEFPYKPGNLATYFKDQSTLAISLLGEFLKLDWRKRITAVDALKHPYFHSPPYPAEPGELPTYEDSHELDRRSRPKPQPVPARAANNSGPRSGTDQGSRVPSMPRGAYASRNNTGGFRHNADDSLPPRPHASQQPWPPNRRNDNRGERWRDGHHPFRPGNRGGDGRNDSYGPRYDGHDRPRPSPNDGGLEDARYGNRRDAHNSMNRRRSRSPVPRDRGREDSNYNLYRR